VVNSATALEASLGFSAKTPGCGGSQRGDEGADFRAAGSDAEARRVEIGKQ